MVEPCRECGGSGEIATLGPEHTDPCSRCSEMPKLRCATRLLSASVWKVEHGWCDGRGWFHPDPDTVMWWCFAHNQPMSACFVFRLVTCDPGWVARPEGLETVE